jgi:hypothetical protein
MSLGGINSFQSAETPDRPSVLDQDVTPAKSIGRNIRHLDGIGNDKLASPGGEQVGVCAPEPPVTAAHQRHLTVKSHHTEPCLISLHARWIGRSKKRRARLESYFQRSIIMTAIRFACNVSYCNVCLMSANLRRVVRTATPDCRSGRRKDQTEKFHEQNGWAAGNPTRLRQC